MDRSAGEVGAGHPAPSIWLYAFGYFAAYVPYASVTKALTNGTLAKGISGTAILPLSAVVSCIGMFTFLGVSGWWRSAGAVTWRGRRVPMPSRWTALSGVATTAVILTTTLAYSFAGTSVVLMMLLMRGGVLVIAPIADVVSGRKVRWYSWGGLALSGVALGHAGMAVGGGAISVGAAIDVAVYLAAYFLRIRFMSKLAKGAAADNRRFFVEEQMVATPVAVLALGVVAMLPLGSFAADLRTGFFSIPFGHAAPYVVLIGVTSQLTGIFGALVLLDPRENTFCVPVNRGSSLIAGVIGSLVLAALGVAESPSNVEIAGAVWVCAAVALLAVGPRLRKASAKP